MLLHLSLPAGFPFGWSGWLADIEDTGQRKKIGGFKQGGFFFGVFVVGRQVFQNRDGIGAAELFGGFNGSFPDLFFGVGQVGQDVGEGLWIIIHGPLLEAVGLGVNGRLALFIRQGSGGNRRSGDGRRRGWRDIRDGGGSLGRGGFGFGNGDWSRRRRR